jgi:glycosyltransferase involved in cell wall biosynthesis
LARSLQAIYDQVYDGNIECIVVFDQSEPVAPIVTPRANRTMRLTENSRVPGLPGARNTGAEAASGCLLAFCDDDDEWLPDKLRVQVEALSRNPKAVVVSCRAGKVTRRMPSSDVASLSELIRSRRVDIHPSTVMVSRERFLSEIGPIDESLPGGYAEDYEWLLRAARLGDIVTVRRELVWVHWHPQSWFHGRWGDISAALEYLLTKYPEFAEDRRGQARIFGQIAIAKAAADHRSEAAWWAMRTLRNNPAQPRAYLALLLIARLANASQLQRIANAYGRGL